MSTLITRNKNCQSNRFRNPDGEEQRRSDTLIRHEGIQALRERLDPFEAERVIVLINRDSFDYTEWQQTLWQKKVLTRYLQWQKSIVNK
ncbi:MAG: hypothetical protein ACOYOE_13760 [Chlorobium sp.]